MSGPYGDQNPSRGGHFARAPWPNAGATRFHGRFARVAREQVFQYLNVGDLQKLERTAAALRSGEHRRDFHPLPVLYGGYGA